MSLTFAVCTRASAILFLLAVRVSGIGAQSSAAAGARAFTIEVARSHSLQDDGKGRYRDGEDGVGAFGLFAITLCSDGRRCSTFPEAAPVTASARTLKLDLRSPVAGSGAVSRGIVTAVKANFGAFWEQDTTTPVTYNGRQGWIIRSALDIPVGRTVVSERVEIRFFANDKQYVLQFGPWTAGKFQPNQGPLSGQGTTAGTISHTSDSTWVVKSGTQSVGRLWDNSDPSKPRDLGLYAFSFEVRYTPLERSMSPPANEKTASDRSRTSRPSDADTLRTLAQIWMDAAQRQDTLALNRMMAHEFKVVRLSDGRHTPRAEWVSGTTRHPTKALNFERVDVVSYGDSIAIVAGVLRVEVTEDGKPITSRIAVTDVWQNREGRWQILTRYASRP